MHVIDGAPRCIDGGMNADRCVYAKFRETGEPFYIGKGSQKRAWDHEQEARRGKRSHKCHIIRDMWSRGHEPITVMLHEGLTETTANEYEMAFIRAIGRADLGLGPLANLTDGGDGTTGHKPSPEVIAKLVARLRGKKLPPDIVARRLGRKMSPVAVGKTAAAHRGSKRSPETCSRISAAVLGRSISPEALAKWHARKHSPETIAKLRAMRHTPEARAKMSEAGRGKTKSAEHRANIAAALRNKKHPPEHVAAMVAGRHRLSAGKLRGMKSGFCVSADATMPGSLVVSA